MIRKNWKGWKPSQSDMDSDPSYLGRTDNVVFDQDGMINGARGTLKQSSLPFGSIPVGLFSRPLQGGTVGSLLPVVNARYVAYNSGPGVQVLRNWSGGTPNNLDFAGGVLSGGAGDYAAFGEGWGHTFIYSGTQKRADPGPEAQWRDLGIPAPLPPGVLVNPNPWSPSIWSTATDWVTIEGTELGAAGDYYNNEVSGSTFRSIAQAPDVGIDNTWDTTDFGTAGEDDPNDLFTINFRCSDYSAIQKVRIEFLLDIPQTPSATIDVSDFFWFEWLATEAVDTNPTFLDPDVYEFSDRSDFINQVQLQMIPGVQLSTFFREGENFWGTLQARRYQIKRVGTNSAKGWDTVKAVRVIVQATSQIDSYIGKLAFIGSVKGLMNGDYSYIQVNVNENGQYTEFGLASQGAEVKGLINTNVTVTPAAVPGNANRAYIFRSGTQMPGYYLVAKVQAPYSPFIDYMSDIDALRDGVALEDFRVAIPNGIRYVVGPYYQRMIMFDFHSLYPSFLNDPGSYDSRFAMRICGSDNEVILFAVKVIDGEIIVATTNDFYAIRGDFTFDEQTQLLNVAVQPLGIEQPATSLNCFAVYGTSLVYLSQGGWRVLEGSTSYPLIQDVDRLYKGYSAYGIDPVRIESRGAVANFCAVSKDRLICSVDQGATGRALHIYDFLRKNWTYWRNVINGANNARSLFAESDGTVLFTPDTNGYLYQWDVGNTLDGDGPNASFIRTIWDADGKPNQRKDPLVMRLRANSGGADFFISINGTHNVTLQFPTLTDVYVPISFLNAPTLAVPKRFQLDIYCPTTTFQLEEMEILYFERPPQTRYLKIDQEPRGVIGRKRIPGIGIEIDTLGNNVDFVPIIDNVALAQSSHTTNERTLVNHFFSPEETGRMIGGYLNCPNGVFEFYGMLDNKLTEVLPDPVKYLYINTTNFGTTKRKRIGQLAFSIDTRGSNVTYTPIIDRVAQTPITVNTSTKQTVIYYFGSSTVGIELEGTLSGANPFEFYGYDMNECAYEVLPAAYTFMKLPTTNFGTTRRKKLGQVGLMIDTKGSPVSYVPIVDGVQKPAETILTTDKSTFIYHFDSETEGIDLSGLLSGDAPFEFYGYSLDDSAYEVLNPAYTYFETPVTNFGNASKKRIRTIPFIINTLGGDVTVTAYVDGVEYPAKTVNTTDKRTQFYLFDEDAFGVDVWLKLDVISGTAFEFYGIVDPQIVEVLPVQKLFDQFGPVDFNKMAKVRAFRLRILPTVATLHYRIYSEDAEVWTSTLSLTPNKDQQIIEPLPKSVFVETMRMEIWADGEFHRWKCEFQLASTGAMTELQWVTVR